MKNNNKVATVFGGTGFIGAQIVRELAKDGWVVKVATRMPARAYFLRPCGAVGQVVPFACDYSAESIRAAVAGASAVVNCVGILYERRRGDFTRVHTELPRLIAQACATEGAGRFVHVSALACERGTSRYARSKLAGEAAARDIFPAITVLRPSVVFGPGDRFFNMFAEIARYAPALPLIGGGRTLFQPVYVGDVADAVMAALRPAQAGGDDTAGKIYELGGPEVLSFRALFERMFAATGRRRPLVALPWGISRVKAAILGLLPHPPLTGDQVESLRTDNVVAAGALALENLGIRSTGMALILPGYLAHYRPGGRFGDKKRA